MNKFLTNTYPIINLHKKASTKSEIVTQMIYGESFHILKRDEKTMGELFSFFILETILLGKALKVNPFDQPSVELIKTETRKILL